MDRPSAGVLSTYQSVFRGPVRGNLCAGWLVGIASTKNIAEPKKKKSSQLQVYELRTCWKMMQNNSYASCILNKEDCKKILSTEY